VAKAGVRVLPHRVDKQVEGVARQGGHMTLVCTIVILAENTSGFRWSVQAHLNYVLDKEG
jgi:hypothetical protein